VRPVEATVEAVDELDPHLDDGTLLARLVDMGNRVHALVPQAVGLSIASIDQGISFTVVATDEEIAVLDAMQYVESGPCVAAADLEQGVATAGPDLFDERAWRLFALATSAAGVRSTLTLPVVVAGLVRGTVNLYAAADHAFDGHHEELARICGAWAPGAVANADLGFASRRTAEEAPGILRADARIESAVGFLAATLGIDYREARQRLRAAAERAGVAPHRLAAAILKLRTD
jgi:GAF domain-containing protein